MNKKTITISLLAVTALGGFLIFSGPKTTSAPTQNDPGVSDAQLRWETKTDDQAGVTVAVTPANISPESEEWTFAVAMDTHTVQLNQDMTRVAVLVDEQGKQYKALKWEGPTGSHHREGVLTFARVTPTPRSIELKISDVGGVTRSFSWEFKE